MLAGSARHPVLSILVCALVLSFTIPAPSDAGPAPRERARPSGADWSLEAKRLAEASEYEVSWQAGTALPGVGQAWHAPNRAHNLRSWFTVEGLRVVPRVTGEVAWEIGLVLTGYGRGEALATPDEATLVPDRNRIEYRRRELIEWYVNDPAGLEQGFTLTVPPEEARGYAGAPGARGPGAARPGHRTTESAEPAWLALTLTGDLRPVLDPEGQAIDLYKAGSPLNVARYASLVVRDADERELPSWMELFTSTDRQGIRLVFDDTGAVYPVTVDPLLTSASWTGEGNQTGAQFGYAVDGAGDVNCDGYDDVLVGAPYYDKGQVDEGRVFLYLGSSAGLETLAAWTAEGDQADARFGWSVAGAGNVNRDPNAGTGCPADPNGPDVWDDIIIGAPGYDTDPNLTTNEGWAFVYHGSPSGPDHTGNGTCPADADWCASPGRGDSNDSAYGHDVDSAGDVNGDGFDDVIIGLPEWDTSYNNSGAAWAYHGSAAGLSATPAWQVTGGGFHHENFGYAVAGIGNIDDPNSPWDDVVVGSPQWGSEDVGRIYWYLGSATGLATTPPGNRQGGQYSSLGGAVDAAGDVNGDGFDDFIVGQAYFDGGGDTDKGRVWIFYGNSSPSGFASTIIEGWQAYMTYGRAVAGVGDVNGDGFDDVLAGTGRWDAGGTSGNEGHCRLYLGSATGVDTSFDWHMNGDQPGGELCDAVAGAGDVNGDGWSDVVLGAPGYDNDKTDEGRAYVYQSAMVSADDLVRTLGFAPSGTAEWTV